MSLLIKTTIKVKSIKTTYYKPENSKNFTKTLSTLVKIIFPLETIVVHKGTMELIANGHYYQLAIDRDQDEIEVLLADFPKDDLLHAIVTHWTPTKRFALMYPLITVLMTYYSLKGGLGAKYRESFNDFTLREFVAEFLGTNKTYLDMIEAIGNFKPELLELVDAHELSLQEAFAMVPKNKKKKKNSSNGHDGGDSKMENYQVPVKGITELSADDITTLCNNLPSPFNEEIGNGTLSVKLKISKCFTYDHIFQGFVIVYQYEGKSVIIQIAYTEDLRSILLKAA